MPEGLAVGAAMKQDHVAYWAGYVERAATQAAEARQRGHAVLAEIWENMGQQASTLKALAERIRASE
jgi:hypothetical protein